MGLFELFTWGTNVYSKAPKDKKEEVGSNEILETEGPEEKEIVLAKDVEVVEEEQPGEDEDKDEEK